MNSLEELLHDQLKDLYSAEQQLVKALPRMARGVTTPELKAAIETHLQETEGQVERLEQVAERVGVTLRGKKCRGMEGLIQEGKELLESDGDETILDAGIIAAAQKVEHYEISAYGSARALAEQLGLSEVVDLLQATLDEESAADEKLTAISQESVLPAGKAGMEDEDRGQDETGQGQAEHEPRQSRGTRRTATANSHKSGRRR